MYTMRLPVILLVLCTLLQISSFAQGMGQQRIHLDPSTARPLPELGIVLQKPEKEDQISVFHKIPTSSIDSLDFQEGDVLVSINGKPIRTLKDIDKYYGDAKVGAKMEFGMERNGKKHSVSFNKPKPSKRGGPIMIRPE